MLKDLLKTDLKIVFCGINPGLKSAFDGHHFSGRSNRFWKVLHKAGFTPYEIQATNDISILDFGYGLTTAVEKATARADELSKSDFGDSVEAFRTKMEYFRPNNIAFLGKVAFLAFSGKKQTVWGLQEEEFCGAKVWVLPNPSGLNRGFTLNDLITEYGELFKAINLE
jgi:TDG/mug DNA glycosylase family protein